MRDSNLILTEPLFHMEVLRSARMSHQPHWAELAAGLRPDAQDSSDPEPGDWRYGWHFHA